MKNKKSILISSFHPLVSRNLLQAGVLAYLVESDWRVVILCPARKADFFRQNFQSKEVSIVGVADGSLGWREGLIYQLALGLLPTSTVRLNWQEHFRANWHHPREMIRYGLFLLLQHTLALSRWWRAHFRSLVEKWWPLNVYDQLLKEIKPDLVFASDIFHPEDGRLLVAARRQGIKSKGMVRSWDNATNKGVLVAAPDQLIVHNHIIKGEMVEWHGFDARHIIVTGIPQFDYYLDYRPTQPTQFFERTGLAADRPVILFAPTGQKFVDDDGDLLQLLIEGIQAGEIAGRPQILVRFPPGDTANLAAVKIPSEIKVAFDHPGVPMLGNKLKDRELDQAEMANLADTLYYADVLISVGSTLCIDIAAFGKPVICPKFKIPGVPYFRSMVKMYDKYHYQYLFTSGGCLLADTPARYLELINRCLLQANFNRGNQIKLLQEQAGRLDGRAAIRVAQAIMAIEG